MRSNGSVLSPEQLEELNTTYAPKKFVSGIVSGHRDSFQQLILQREMTNDELTAAVQMDVSYSQHSSIVASDKAPSHAMVYDLAIGQCEAFENQEFWERLLLRADWRRAENPISDEKNYYQKGLLPYEHIKQFMNKPEREKGMPLGEEFGVTNDYGSARWLSLAIIVIWKIQRFSFCSGMCPNLRSDREDICKRLKWRECLFW